MKKNIKSILITNDDGFNAAGLKVLKEVAESDKWIDILLLLLNLTNQQNRDL